MNQQTADKIKEYIKSEGDYLNGLSLVDYINSLVSEDCNYTMCHNPECNQCYPKETDNEIALRVYNEWAAWREDERNNKKLIFGVEYNAFPVWLKQRKEK